MTATPNRLPNAAELAGLVLIALVAFAVNVTLGFHTPAAAVVLLAGLGLLVLAEHKLTVPARDDAPRVATGTRARA
ncbi:MAG TPA: hypothetical protein VMT10_06555 [Solirubrobacteraceae bacterium]|nr:hypothetical protein [Solirubrobacteraceae bacterium]